MIARNATCGDGCACVEGGIVPFTISNQREIYDDCKCHWNVSCFLRMADGLWFLEHILFMPMLLG